MAGDRKDRVGRRVGSVIPALLLLSCVAVLAGDLDPERFPVPAVLEPNVEFWVKIYSTWNSDQAVLHDEVDLDVVYGVVELGDLEQPGVSEGRLRELRSERVEDHREEVIAVLESLRGSREGWGADARHYRETWSAVEGWEAKLPSASRRVRVQNGLRDRFAEAIVRSGRYMQIIEAAMKAERVPSVLSRLPFVESMFVNDARSKVGASGAWQFMPGTARLYLPMSSAVDSRMDPMLAAEGAAKMLRADYDVLESWPLALTAYNHGRGGMTRAVRTVGSRDLGEIVQSYRARRFGFASRNFYAEFVAAVKVYEERRERFPEVTPAPALQFDEFVPEHYVSLLDLGSLTGVGVDQLQQLNPALESEVFTGTLLVPKGYPLRVPATRGPEFRQAYASIPEGRLRSRQVQAGYRVRSGDTLSGIARRFGTSMNAIQRANHLRRSDRIYINQTLRIPGQNSKVFQTPISRAGDTTASTSVPDSATHHRVSRGESLTLIARRYGLTVEELASENGMTRPDQLAIGQVLRLPRAGTMNIASVSTPSRHVVRRGENLSVIAGRYGVSVSRLLSANRLSGSRIYPGQVLVVP